MKIPSGFLFGLCLCTATWADSPGMHLEYRIMIPQRFLQTTATPPPGPPERIRYSDAYEAFWWNCVVVKAADMRAGCPSTINGTPGEIAGAANGARAALDGIQTLVKQYGAAAVQAYLKQLASPGMVKSKLHGYFKDTPTAEPKE